MISDRYFRFCLDGGVPRLDLNVGHSKLYIIIYLD